MYIKKFLNPILILFFANFLQATELRILFTSSLNGNLDGCTCKLRPISGLVKRGHWIEEYRKSYPNIILVDTGDSLLDPKDLQKARSIYDAFTLLKYDAYLPGESDFSIGVSNFLDASKNMNLIGTNFFYNPGFFKKNQFFGTDELILEREKINLRILGYLDEDTLLYAKDKLKSKIEFIKEVRIPKRKRDVFLTIALSHAGYDKDMKWMSEIDFPMIVIGGHDQYLPKSGAGFEVFGGIWYFQAGGDGNLIGEIVVDVKKDGTFQVISHKLHSIDFANTPDHLKIREIIQGIRN